MLVVFDCVVFLLFIVQLSLGSLALLHLSTFIVNNFIFYSPPLYHDLGELQFSMSRFH